MVKIPSSLVQEIQDKENFVLFAHSNPDGDALGSLFGLACILESLGKQVWCFLESDVPVTLGFLPKQGKLCIGTDALAEVLSQHPDAYGIALDCGDQYRLGMFRDPFLALPCSWVIDHHKSHIAFGKGTWVEESLSSTAEMVYELSLVLGATLSPECAENLYTAIVTDTGSFRFSSTSKRTHEVAGELLSLGVQPDKIGQALYDSWSLSRMRLMQQVLATLHVSDCSRIASVYANSTMLQELDTVMAETEGFIDYPRSLKTTEVAVFFKDPGDQTISVSMRGKGGCDVSEIAAQFGGGGHKNAAGCRITGVSLAEAKSQVYAAITKALG